MNLIYIVLVICLANPAGYQKRLHSLGIIPYFHEGEMEGNVWIGKKKP